jgi:hypothetical protein
VFVSFSGSRYRELDWIVESSMPSVLD